MPRVAFTENLQRHAPCPTTDAPAEAAGETVRQVMQAVFKRYPKTQPYVLDEHGGLRKHMIIFINGQMIQDRQGLTDPVPSDALIFVMQSLSGG